MENKFNPRSEQYDLPYLDQKIEELIKQFNDVELSRNERDGIDHYLYLIIKNQKCVDQKLIEKHFDKLPWEHRVLSIQNKLPSFNFLLERLNSSLDFVEIAFLKVCYKEEFLIYDKQQPQNSEKTEDKFDPVIKQYDLSFLDEKIKNNIEKINDKNINFTEKVELNHDLYCIFSFQWSVTTELAEKYFDNLLDNNKSILICRKFLSLDFLIERMDSLSYLQLSSFSLYYHEKLRRCGKDKLVTKKIKEKAEKLVSEIKAEI